MLKIVLAAILLVVITPNFSYGATPFFANDRFTQNGIEWCEENYQLYLVMKDDFFVHHSHSIESRVCASLYSDPLWTYYELDRYQKLIERSAYYVNLEISESHEESKTGTIEVTPAAERVDEKNNEAESIPPDTQDGESDMMSDTTPEEKTQTKQEGGGCLIATAAYGSELAPQVQFLREIRDNTLLSTTLGASFMTGFNSLYYSFSPAVADLERESPIFREAVKLFITPMLSTLSIMMLADEGSESQVLGLGISVIALNLGMYVAMPTAFGLAIKKHLRQ